MTTRSSGMTSGQLMALATAGVVVLLLVLIGITVTDPAPTAAALPNPMGGPVREAPGEASGQVVFGGLEVTGTEVAMGDVPLGVTVVPSWQVTNPTGSDLSFTAGMPQVLEGCCPGPVYADGDMTAPGEDVTVPAGESVLVQFPLQMHPGMDGPHHLQVPVTADGGNAALQVTGNFTAEA